MTQEAREALVLEHMESENRHDFDDTLSASFGHPRYETVASGQVFEGPAGEEQLVPERVCFNAPSILGRPGLAPSLPLPA